MCPLCVVRDGCVGCASYGSDLREAFRACRNSQKVITHELCPWISRSRLVLATPTTATDADYAAIEAVVG